MYNGWTDWETWVAVLWLNPDGETADELRDFVDELAHDLPNAGLVRDLIEGSIREINFEEIERAFEPEVEEDDDDFPIDDEEYN